MEERWEEGREGVIQERWEGKEGMENEGKKEGSLKGWG